MSMIRIAFAPLACALVLAAGACQMRESAAGPGAGAAVLPGKVQDLPAFDAFIAEKPLPEAFRARYPDVRLVLPGDITTKEMRTDRGRYFADLDAQGRIAGGKFM